MNDMHDPPVASETPRSMLTREQIFAIERPKNTLLIYYVLSSLLLGPFFFFLLIPLYFRYLTLRYQFDDEGVAMRWGILFRRETHLRYARIQDIHLVSNVVERWLGLARIKIQTASGSSQAEMTIEGIEEFQELRDFLYTRMRGTRTGREGLPVASGSGGMGLDPQNLAELTATLREVGHELRALRQDLGARGLSGKDGAPGAGRDADV